MPDNWEVQSSEITRQDIRQTALFREAEALYQALRHPGTGFISDAAEISAHGDRAVFAGTLTDSLNGEAPTRICSTDLCTGDTRVVTFGPNVDRSPKFSPDGQHVAFLSDRHKSGDFQLYLLNLGSSTVQPTPHVAGWAEYLHWAPDGKRILLGVAGHGADVSALQGAVSSKRVDDEFPSWMPAVESGDESCRWRGVCIYELTTNRVCRLSLADCNIWEAAWCGDRALAAVASAGPSEGLWYCADLKVIDLDTGHSRALYKPRDQLGWPAASPSGKHVAVIEGICSDRGLVAGDLLLIDAASGRVERLNSQSVDVTYTEWRSEGSLLLAGHRGFETVVGVYDVTSATLTEVWASRKTTTGGAYVSVSGLNETGDCALVGEGFVQAPEIATIQRGKYRTVKSFDPGCTEQLGAVKTVEPLSWMAPDGLEIQGWLLRPHGEGPHPLVMNLHGGPVWHSRPMWLGRGGVLTLMLVKHGFCVFLPNPRGSTGRGQEFARQVVGDMGGVDSHDCLSGLDFLIEHGVADRRRLGVMGGSYGGFLTSWLIGQDSRFAAAVSLAPVTNQVTEHLLSNIPHFVSKFLQDTYTNFGGKYFQRSPIMHAHNVKTPTLNICGALDCCTPPEEAVQFHRALLENNERSVLVTYPEEGHGIYKWPAAIDYVARVVAWFDRYMPANDHPS